MPELKFLRTPFLQNTSGKVLLKQINVFIEMVTCLAVSCKSDTRQGKDQMLMNFQGKKM